MIIISLHLKALHRDQMIIINRQYTLSRERKYFQLGNIIRNTLRNNSCLNNVCNQWIKFDVAMWVVDLFQKKV